MKSPSNDRFADLAAGLHTAQRRWRARPVALLALLVLAACSTAPALHYYTLLPPVDASALAGRLPADVELLPVRVAAQADHPQLVVREGRQRVALIEDRLWSAPLPDEVRSALRERLAARLPAGPAAAERLRVEVEVARLDAALDRYALLEADWKLKAGERVLACSTRSLQTVEPGYDALVAGHQRTVQALADAIAAGIASLRAGSPACPAA